MKILPDSVYRITLEETYKENDVVIVQAVMDVRAQDMETACKIIRDYFGMGIKITLLKCELCG